MKRRIRTLSVANGGQHGGIMDTPTSAHRVTAALIDAGLLEPARGSEAEVVVASVIEAPHGETSRLGRRVAEIAGYVGGVFIVGAVLVFFSGSWDSLERAARITVLLVAAAVLGGSTAALVVSGGGVRALRPPREAVRRRLGSVLLAGAAWALGFAVVIALSPTPSSDSEWPLVAGSGMALLVAVAGYLLLPTVLSQLGVAIAAVVVIAAGVSAVAPDRPTVIGVLYLVLGLAWLWLAETRTWREAGAGRILGCVLAVIGAQLPIVDGAVGYLLTGAVGLAAFGAYAVRPKWPYLAAGVVGLTLAVPEALTDLVSGSMGAAGALLAAGVTLLLASLLGLRLRKEVADAQ